MLIIVLIGILVAMAWLEAEVKSTNQSNPLTHEPFSKSPAADSVISI
jgi:hypothetical protein